MNEEYEFKKATIKDIDLLTKTRIEVLRAANKLDQNIDMTLVEKNSYIYYKESLKNDEHVAFMIFEKNNFVGCGGVSFFSVMPTYHNPSGRKAYVMNMYTRPEYRRKGIAIKTLELLIQEAKNRNITHISLEATEMGKYVYQKYGFQEMTDEMELKQD